MYSLESVASFSRIIYPYPRFEHEKEFKVWPWPPDSPDLSLIEHLTIPINGGPILELTRLKGFASVLVPGTTVHLQRPYGAHASSGQGCFGGTTEAVITTLNSNEFKIFTFDLQK